MVLYFFFAILSIALNLFLQYLVSWIAIGEGSFFFRISVGTLGGLLFKYTCDKTFVFKDKYDKKKLELKKFTLYSLFGIVTTVIFWGTEYLFSYVFGKNFEYLGGFIGLSMGYYLKYCLDKKYVFYGTS